MMLEVRILAQCVRRFAQGCGKKDLRDHVRRSPEFKRTMKNPNTFGPLTNLPDFRFADGRPTPLGANQKRRLQKQQEIIGKMVIYNKELQFAKDRFIKKD